MSRGPPNCRALGKVHDELLDSSGFAPRCCHTPGLVRRASAWMVAQRLFAIPLVQFRWLSAAGRHRGLGPASRVHPSGRYLGGGELVVYRASVRPARIRLLRVTVYWVPMAGASVVQPHKLARYRDEF